MLAAALFFFGTQAVAALDAEDPNTGGVGDLLVAPTRVVLEGRTRAAEIILNNTGEKEATYRIGLIHLHMDENGKYKDIPESALDSSPDKPAKKLLRFSPHQVTLKPGESQTVKIMVRKPEGLADGEYRSHIAFHAVPETATGEDVEEKEVETGKIAIRLIPIYGVSIPVIVREGTLSAKAGISGMKRTGNTLSLAITRNGGKSLYGDVLVTDASGKVVGEMRGVAVLVPNQSRRINVSLSEGAGGNLSVEFRSREDEENATLAKATL